MNTVLIVIGLMIAGVIFLRWLAMRKIKNTPLVASHEKIVTLTDKNFQQQTKNRIVLVDFWAEWCAPCRMMAPILNDVAAELDGNAAVGKVDIQQYQSLAQRFKVRSIPTLILFRDGKEINRYVGVKSKEFILKELAKESSKK